MHDINDYGKYIYHYTKIKTCSDYILQDMTLQFGIFSRTNDPREFDTPPTVLSTSGKMGKRDFDFLNEYQHSLISGKNRFNVTCFCEDNEEIMGKENSVVFGKGWARARMWAQYADSHKGVCIVFDKAKLIDEVTKQASEFRHGEIKYENRNPALESLLDIHIDEETELTLEIESKIIDKLYESLFYKFDDYRDENEFRVIVKQEGENLFKLNIASSIHAVIFGAKSGLEYSSIDYDEYLESKRYRIIELCKKKNIDMYNAMWSVKEPWLSGVSL